MMLFLSLFVLALAAVSPSDGQELKLKLQRGDCPMFWFSFNGRCYKYFATHMTWSDAELYCLSENSNLVSIHSRGEQEFVNSLIKNFDPAQGKTWIGLSDIYKEGGWMWSDGCKYSFSQWDPAQPDNMDESEHCVRTNFGENYEWNDLSCSLALSFVCATRIGCPV